MLLHQLPLPLLFLALRCLPCPTATSYLLQLPPLAFCHPSLHLSHPLVSFFLPSSAYIYLLASSALNSIVSFLHFFHSPRAPAATL
ncbi:hypothetical protein BDR05DRAFT_95726 [Suillus weaverae]|nr:hypothetical protein BDR05DRAFT_95726 [Suillus weaverae]